MYTITSGTRLNQNGRTSCEPRDLHLRSRILELLNLTPQYAAQGRLGLPCSHPKETPQPTIFMWVILPLFISKGYL